jgi:hypothetical protein
MRFLLSLFVGCALLSAGSLDDFSITDPATYSGSLPCPDCAGIRYVLTLHPDGVFYRQRTFLRTENSGQRQLDFGYWASANGVLTMNSSLGNSIRFSAKADGTLIPLDEQGNPLDCPKQPDGCVLKREGQSHIPEGSYRIRGLYTNKGGRLYFQPCGASLRFHALQNGRPKQAELLATVTKGGQPALLTITGTFETPNPLPAEVAKPNSISLDILHIANVIDSKSGGSCEAAATPLSVAR